MMNKPELKQPLLLLIMSSLVISTSTEIPQTQQMTTSRPLQEHLTEIQTAGDPGVTNTTKNFNQSLSTAHPMENITSGDLDPNRGTERSSTNARPAGSENATVTESPSVRISESISQRPALTHASSVVYREGTHRQATNSDVAVVTTSHGPPTVSNVTQSAITHAEKETSGIAKQASTKPQITTTQGKSTTTTTTTTKEVHICPTNAPKKENIVSHCLIAIAFLAGLATIFIVSTIVLATKLAGSRYRHKMHLLQDTEMVCISALMNDTEHPVPKPRHPKSNGALIPSTEDEDGDALTLNSFLPETEGTALG